MNNEEKNTKEERQHHGPPGMRRAAEKPKDLKKAIKRLVQGLKNFKLLILTSLILAALSAILAIFSPNIIKDLTDEISKGLVINSKNLELVTKEITANFTSPEEQLRISQILSIDMTEQNIISIMQDSTISQTDKEAFQNYLKNASSNKEEAYRTLGNLKTSILERLLKDSTFEGKVITSWEKIELLKLSDSKELKLSKNLQSILLSDITVKDQKITSKDQVKFLSLMSSFQGKKDINVNALYKKLDKLPNSIKTLVEPNMNLSKIKSIVTLLITLYVISAIFTYFEAITMTQAANRFARKLRTSISTKINKLPLKYFDQHATGDILSRVTNDIDTIAQAMNQSLSTLVSSTTLLIGTIIMMFVTNWILALTAIFSSLFGFIFMALVLGKSQKYFTARQKELGNLNGHIEEIYSGLNVVKTYNGVEESNKKFDDLNKK